MIRFEQKPATAPAPEEKPKKAAKPVEPVQLSLDPEAQEENASASAKPGKRKSSVRSK